MSTARSSSLLGVAIAIAACVSAIPTRAQSPRIEAPPDLREQTADQQVNQALSRLTFGARPGDVQRVRELGVDRWIELQLQPERIDDRVAELYLRRFRALDMTAGQLLADYPRPQALQQNLRRDSASMTAMERQQATMELRQAQQQTQTILGEIQTAKVARALLSERQLHEVMVDFWENHFSVFQGKAQVRYYLADYDRAIRPHALGRFRDLLEAVAKSPAMLLYLDNARSGANPGQRTYADDVLEGPVQPARGRARGAGRILQNQRRPGLNENYARELLELHTLGVDGGYTQQDVIEVARALTGWSVTPEREGVALAAMNVSRPGVVGGGIPGAFVFRPEMHDSEAKRVLGAGLPGGQGIVDGLRVLDIVSKHPSTARFIATKLARRFVSDTPPAALVDRAAATFTRTDGNIREVVRTIVTSPEFFSQSAYRSKVKTPFELVASTLRALNALPDPTPRSARMVGLLGQPIFGKETPNGYPDFADQWMNTGAILNRINFGTTVASGQFPGVVLDRWPTAQQVGSAPREQQVDAVIASLLSGAASPDTRAILITGRNPFLDANPGADTTAISVDDEPPAMGAPGQGRRGRGAGGGRGRGMGAARRPVELTGLAQIVGLALGSPEFQRR
jgi:uncharacterized protein (DUF1800 family)